jgi:hypothetical protein
MAAAIAAKKAREDAALQASAQRQVAAAQAAAAAKAAGGVCREWACRTAAELADALDDSYHATRHRACDTLA